MVKRSDTRIPLAELITDDDAFFGGIEIRNRIARSDVLRAQLRAIIKGDVPRWVRPPKQSDIDESVEKAQELLGAMQSLKSFGDLIHQWQQWSFRGPPARQTNVHIRQLGEAIHRCGLDVDRVPLM